MLCYNTNILHYHWLSHFSVACQRLVVSHLTVRCCKTFAMVLCFYGNHITCPKLCKNFCVSDLLCNFFSLSLNLKFDACAVSYHLSLSSLSYKKQVGVKFFKLIPLRVSFVCVSVISKVSIVSILPFFSFMFFLE